VVLRLVLHSSALVKLKQMPKQLFGPSAEQEFINGKDSLLASEDGNDSIGTSSGYGVVNCPSKTSCSLAFLEVI